MLGIVIRIQIVFGWTLYTFLRLVSWIRYTVIYVRHLGLVSFLQVCRAWTLYTFLWLVSWIRYTGVLKLRHLGSAKVEIAQASNHTGIVSLCDIR